MKLSISLNKPKAGHPSAIVRPSVFGKDADDEVDNDLLTSENPRPHGVPATQVPGFSKLMKKRVDAERRIDETIYEYDEVWDKIQEAKQRQQAAKNVDASARKPKYIQKLLSSAATRKLDHLRAEEKMMQRAREAEGDLYQDKESFVTQAYKDQMEEVRRAEEEERKRDELHKKKGGSSTGITHLYRQMLEESAKNHEATVAASEKRFIGPQPPTGNLTIVKPAEFAPLADAELAKRAREAGKEVELNDDNQIVDKRELLSAGLNLSLPNTRTLNSRPKKSESQSTQSAQTHRAVGTAATRQEINERRTKEIQQQMEAEHLRAELSQKEADDRAMQRIIAKRNNEDDVESARTRYLERKRRKLQEGEEVPVKT